MSKITIKIVEVDQATHSAAVKYISENSKRLIDEYPAVAFQVTNYNATTPEEFIEAIRPQVSLYVGQRDRAENPEKYIDMEHWLGVSREVDAVDIPPPAAIAPPPVEGLANPEVIL
jgi:hypothetical protein